MEAASAVLAKYRSLQAKNTGRESCAEQLKTILSNVR